MTDPSLTKTLARLYGLQASGIKFGLETTKSILERLGHPERGLKCIHVAGTNGKGSVCAMLESILRATGLKTALYTSPHLVRFNERIRVNGRCIADAELPDLIRRVEACARDAAAQPGGRKITFFEFATVLAFDYFRQQGVEIVVLETGMGGRLDATNVVTPLISVITGISLEHTAFLGPDLPSIAREKGGIIKPGIPVIVGPMPEEALAEIRRLAQEKRARLVQADQSVSVRRLSQNLAGQKLKIESSSNTYGALTLPLAGAYQVGNTAIAIAILEELAAQSGMELPERAVKAGLSGIRWPGRFQVVEQNPPLIVDSAHNPAGASVLVQSLRELLPDRPLGLVLGMCADKDLDRFLLPFAGLVKHCWAVPLKNERSRPLAEIAAAAESLGWPVEASTVPLALKQATDWARQNQGVVCVTGSLFLAGEALESKLGADIFAAPPD